MTDTDTAGFADIRPDYQSTSSIMTEYLRAAGLRLTKNLASALFYGIKTDTRHFMVDLSHGDSGGRKMAQEQGGQGHCPADRVLAVLTGRIGLLHHRARQETFCQRRHVLAPGASPVFRRLRAGRGLLYQGGKRPWAMVTGVVGDTLVIVFRNDGIKKDAGFLARAAFGNIGSAGGHKSMGRAEVKQDALPSGLLLSNNRGVEEFVLASLAKIDPVFLPVLRSVRK